MTNFDLDSIVSPLLSWYHITARSLPWRDTPTAYCVWISEIMLQQTRVEAVIPYFNRFIDELPSVAALAAVPEEKLFKLWEGLGYYNRARNLQKAACTIVDEFQGEIPNDFDTLLSLSGIGEYTAGAIASIAFQKPYPAVDGNVLRVISRITLNEADITENNVKKQMVSQIAKIIPKEHPGDFNQALMELGAIVCLPNGTPKCNICPVCYFCKAYKENKTAQIPYKKPKKERKKENRTVFFVVHNNEVALRKREGKGLLAGLWELPNLEGHYREEELSKILKDLGFSLKYLEKMGNAKHIFTHIEWQMEGFFVECSHVESDCAFQFVSVKMLKEELSVPSAFKFYFNKGIKKMEDLI